MALLLLSGSGSSAAARCDSCFPSNESKCMRTASHIRARAQHPCPPSAARQWHCSTPASAKQSVQRCRLHSTASDTDATSSNDFSVTSSPAVVLGSRDDDVLPDSLTDALQQASETTRLAIADGVSLCIVEVLLGEFWDPSSGAVFSEEGDQQRFWKLTRRFVEGLGEEGSPHAGRIKALYPDMGVAAMLKNQWQDAPFRIGSVNERTPTGPDDDIIVLAAPDPQALASVQKVIAGAEGRTVIMFNPRLASGDVGIGLNVRRMQTQLLGSFVTCYSLRPVGDVGSVYRRYPEPWKVFVEDSESPGRYKLAAERKERPAGEALDEIIMDALGMNGAEGGEGEGPGLLTQLSRTMGSMQRFMKSLSN